MGVCTISAVGVLAGVPGLITNSHCSERMFQLDNTPFHQPTTLASNFVGSETVDPDYYRCGILLWKCRGSDANFAAVTNATIEQGRIARPLNFGPRGGLGSRTIDPNNPYFRIVAQASQAVVGDVLDMVGDSSGGGGGGGGGYVPEPFQLEPFCVEPY
jgi:hypothetical protein